MLRVTTTAATNEAIVHVLTHLWERGEREFDILGLRRDQAIEMAVNWRESGFPTLAWLANDVPVFVIGLTPSAPGVMCTWFQATEEFDKYQREITRFLRKSLREYAQSSAVGEIEIFSTCVHPRTARWFKSLGFAIDVDRHPAEGLARTYRFVRRFHGMH